MHRVELKDIEDRAEASALGFLMHRVELKAWKKLDLYIARSVPNAPCGVESCVFGQGVLLCMPVPNAPRGVERALLETLTQVPLRS